MEGEWKIIRAARFVDKVNQKWGEWWSQLIVLTMVITVYEVFMRYVFRSPTMWAHETATMIYATFIIIACGYTLRHGANPAHIRMDVFYNRFSPRKKAIVDLIAFTFFLLFVGVILWYGIGFAMRSVKLMENSSSTWGPPIWPIKVAVPIGIFGLFIQGIFRFIRNLNTAFTGKETT